MAANNSVPQDLGAYTLEEVAAAWGYSTRQILQLAIDERIRLGVYKRADTIVSIDEEGNCYEEDLNIWLGGYRYICSEDIAEIDKEGQAEVAIFVDPSEGLTVHKKSITVRLSHLRITREERKRFEDESFPNAETAESACKDTEIGKVAEMNANRALAIMAWILSRTRWAYKIGDRPNASKIGKEVSAIAAELWDDEHGLQSFHKRLKRALNTFEEDREASRFD